LFGGGGSRWQGNGKYKLNRLPYAGKNPTNKNVRSAGERALSDRCRGGKGERRSSPSGDELNTKGGKNYRKKPSQRQRGSAAHTKPSCEETSRAGQNASGTPKSNAKLNHKKRRNSRAGRRVIIKKTKIKKRTSGRIISKKREPARGGRLFFRDKKKNPGRGWKKKSGGAGGGDKKVGQDIKSVGETGSKT